MKRQEEARNTTSTLKGAFLHARFSSWINIPTQDLQSEAFRRSRKLSDLTVRIVYISNLHQPIS